MIIKATKYNHDRAEEQGFVLKFFDNRTAIFVPTEINMTTIPYSYTNGKPEVVHIGLLTLDGWSLAKQHEGALSD